jgi:hypothetical protein
MHCSGALSRIKCKQQFQFPNVELFLVSTTMRRVHNYCLTPRAHALHVIVIIRQQAHIEKFSETRLLHPWMIKLMATVRKIQPTQK